MVKALAQAILSVVVMTPVHFFWCASAVHTALHQDGRCLAISCCLAALNRGHMLFACAYMLPQSHKESDVAMFRTP